VITEQTARSLVIDLRGSGINVIAPSQSILRGMHHRRVAASFAVDLDAYHELVAVLVSEANDQGSLMPVEPPMCSPHAANAPNVPS
jgi:hypothetical protein